MKTNNTLTTVENATVLDMTTLVTFVMREQFKEQYNFIIDSDSVDNDYIHVLRNNTNIQANKAHNHAFHMYFKHKKQQVNVLCNKANFDAFQSDFRVNDKKTNCKYIVDYAHIIDFMRDIMTYDTNRQTTTAQQTQTATQTQTA